MGNHLTGSIPACLSEVQSLLVLDLSQHRLSGEIPASLAKLPNLGVLIVKENNLSGVFPNPDRTDTFMNLRWLEANRNFLSGSLPVNIRSDNLMVFDVADNKFNGDINNFISGDAPDNNAQRFTRMSWFDVSNNDLSGLFPHVWWNQVSFVRLNLSPDPHGFRAGATNCVLIQMLLILQRVRL